MSVETFDRLTRRVAAMPSRRAVFGTGLRAAGALAAFGLGGVDAKAKNKNKKHKKKGPRGATCDLSPKLCTSSEECCGGRICAQNGCGQPDRPRCCAGIGQPCSGNSCECCGADLDCVDRKCVYAP
jgi:hypothetical protein